MLGGTIFEELIERYARVIDVRGNAFVVVLQPTHFHSSSPFSCVYSHANP
jgi:hypothetical protein